MYLTLRDGEVFKFLLEFSKYNENLELGRNIIEKLIKFSLFSANGNFYQGGLSPTSKHLIDQRKSVETE